MEVTLYLKIFAKCVRKSVDGEYALEHDLEVGKMYEVKQIAMGSSSTSIYLKNQNTRRVSYNSVIFDFYFEDVDKDGNNIYRLIDIYKSPLFNPYIKIPIEKLMHFVEEIDFE